MIHPSKKEVTAPARAPNKSLLFIAFSFNWFFYIIGTSKVVIEFTLSSTLEIRNCKLIK